MAWIQADFEGILAESGLRSTPAVPTLCPLILSSDRVGGRVSKDLS